MKFEKSAFLSAFLFIDILYMSSCPASADETPSDVAVIELAKTAILGVPFNRDATITVETTNSLKKVVFPRKTNQSVHALSPARFAATVFVDPATESVVPDPSLTPLSDEQAVFIATNAVPIPFDHSKTVRVERASSVILVTLPDKNHVIAPDIVVSNAPLAKIWIDVESQSVLWARIEVE